MKTIRNSSALRNTKAAVVGTSIAILALASTYFYNEFREDKVIAIVTKPAQIVNIKENYYEKNQDNIISLGR